MPMSSVWRRSSVAFASTQRIPEILARSSTSVRGHPCPITSPAVPDHLWIPQVAQHGWTVVTRDSHIQDHRAEIAAVRDTGAKLIALGGADARSTWLQLEILMSQWRRIESLAEQPGPFIWRATRSGLACVPIG